ncbi:hypothetical protein Avbf_00713 [Armadillidium vulgare]|nr:hypothetical protein Avbf_00713 [Armadillidium vulgare]
MPSERRRQRQQRVRHEAGDFVPSTKEENENGAGESANKNSSQEKTEASSDLNSNSSSNFEQKSSNESVHVISNSHPQEERRNPPQRKSTERGGSINRGRGGSSRGRGRADYENQPRKPHTESNVAFQEEREYEPVMIMGSNQKDKKEETPSLPEPVKYRRSEVISNWLRYDDLPPEEEQLEDGEDYLMGEDFSHVLNSSMNNSTGGFLHLKGEMSWGTVDESHLETHGLGALKVADLIASLGTIPLYEQLKIPSESLPVFTVSCMKAAAEKNRSSYKPDQEYITDIEINEKILESLKLNESVPIRLNAEEPESNETHNTLDATLKFSSAFKPEPTDVDLDKFAREGTPDFTQQEKTAIAESLPDGGLTNVATSNVNISEDKKKNKEKAPNKPNTKAKVEAPEEAKKEAPKISNSKTESITNTPKQQQNKPQFNFGLAKANKFSKKIDPEKKSENETSPNNVSHEKQTPIDLNKPLNAPKQTPVLVKESEVENLEDWLDSVLDD